MVSVSKTGSNIIERIIYKPMKKLGEAKPMKRLNKEYQIQNDMVISAVGISSIMLKDGLGCLIYVHQSLNNDKIPEEKRKFIASLDLIKGLLNMVMEISVFFGFKYIQSRLFNKYIGKYFDRSVAKSMKKVMLSSDEFKNVESNHFYNAFNKYKGSVKSAFNQITSLIAASIVAKRVIVPFIATPLAGKLQERQEQKHSQPKSVYHSFLPVDNRIDL